MKLNLLRYKTRLVARSNKALRTSLPYRQAIQIGLIFTAEDKQKHEEIKELVKRLEHEGKQVKVLSFLPKNKENYDFMFDFFSEADLSFWGNITNETANRFANVPFDFLFYLDTSPNPHILNIIARSQSKCRVGLYAPDLVPYFELMVEIKNGTRTLIDAIYRYTSRLR
jgi:hypothetical protein